MIVTLFEVKGVEGEVRLSQTGAHASNVNECTSYGTVVQTSVSVKRTHICVRLNFRNQSEVAAESNGSRCGGVIALVVITAHEATELKAGVATWHGEVASAECWAACGSRGSRSGLLGWKVCSKRGASCDQGNC